MELDEARAAYTHLRNMYHRKRQCANKCETCILPTLTDEERRKRRVYLLWLIARGFPALSADVSRGLVLDWDSDPSPAFSTFTLRCAVNAYLRTPQHPTVVSWGPIRYWDTRAVTHFDSLFRNASTFNERLSWDTRNAVSMEFMFFGASTFNQPIDFRFDKVRATNHMFDSATAFNHPITVRHAPQWRSANFMFYNARSMNANVYCDAPKLVDVFGMFRDASAFRATVLFVRKQYPDTESLGLSAEAIVRYL